MGCSIRPVYSNADKFDRHEARSGLSGAGQHAGDHCPHAGSARQFGDRPTPRLLLQNRPPLSMLKRKRAAAQEADSSSDSEERATPRVQVRATRQAAPKVPPPDHLSPPHDAIPSFQEGASSLSESEGDEEDHIGSRGAARRSHGSPESNNSDSDGSSGQRHGSGSDSSSGEEDGDPDDSEPDVKPAVLLRTVTAKASVQVRVLGGSGAAPRSFTAAVHGGKWPLRRSPHTQAQERTHVEYSRDKPFESKPMLELKVGVNTHTQRGDALTSIPTDRHCCPGTLRRRLAVMCGTRHTW